MAEKPDKTMRVRKWAGRISNASPHVVPLGAAVDQNNVRVQIEGELDVRPGMRLTTCTNTIAAVTDEIIAMASYPGELFDCVVYETSSGLIKCAKNPSIV